VMSQIVEGRNGALTPDEAPSLDPATGRFSGKFPPADNITLGFAGQFAQMIFSGHGTFSATLIGLGLGDARNGIPISYTYRTTSGSGALDTVTIQLAQPTDNSTSEALSDPFDAATSDPSLAARFGVPSGFVQKGRIAQSSVSYQRHTGFGRGCHSGDSLFGGHCSYNGPRWFVGANETRSDPNHGNVAGTGNATDNNNAGELPGVLTIQNPQSYTQISPEYRSTESILAGAVRAADFNVYWGAGGLVDSVIDLTHNVPVPYLSDSLGGGWGFLNQTSTAAPGSADRRPDVLTLMDYGCVFPLNDVRRNPDQEFACSAGTRYTLSQTAVPGAIAIYGGPDTAGTIVPIRPNPGFSLYLAGHIFLFELASGAGVPSTGTVWTLRSYIGSVNGGNGAAGSEGPYAFTSAPRTFSALGATVRLTFDASNSIASPTIDDLSHVHTVPDPYYVTNQYEMATQSKVLKFVNLPADAIIRIYSASGVLVTLLEHHSASFGGAETWNVRSRNNQVVASGVYFYHIESGGARKVGRFTLVNFAE
ncbi:MAG TPA: T9SS type A sorting domain-containing protein, partial [Gemmatimonadales bacterium]|nr:T9SS type A sorting domain-containing protein [Gemmatimonadales bacterium]